MRIILIIRLLFSQWNFDDESNLFTRIRKCLKNSYIWLHATFSYIISSYLIADSLKFIFIYKIRISWEYVLYKFFSFCSPYLFSRGDTGSKCLLYLLTCSKCKLTYWSIPCILQFSLFNFTCIYLSWSYEARKGKSGNYIFHKNEVRESIMILSSASVFTILYSTFLLSSHS